MTSADVCFAAKGDFQPRLPTATIPFYLFNATMTRAFSFLLLLGFLLPSCGYKSEVAPEMTGYVMEKAANSNPEQKKFIGDALVFAIRRVNGCPRNSWLLLEAGGSERIEAKLLRTDDAGGYRVPPISYSSKCEGKVELHGTAYVPGYAVFSGDQGSVLLVPRKPTPERARELVSDLVTARFNGAEIWQAVRKEMKPEVSSYSGSALNTWNEECARHEVCYQ